ncbi:phosphoribosylformylglycinamidine cyclo-ligase [Candidatus Erwinia haradaeae]|uniref:Phosphoribosylformylglycinamidine cyclo-ligase n=1 Tax=Candidatus Erwinia haradaeae TaxID=1922217 RepID=A0A451D758_9GAMM|nr:phosphoribosylformylglycinamidine cyclo-ligase [Candidatus Erwinia haradaeae]VFP81691.1 Phosphoribosylformylglycinamidine cyclo-ligase [Candidatus Erwinia haradaeae]
MSDTTVFSYKNSGVDIDASNVLISRLKGIAKKTRRPEVIGELGSFAALCSLPKKYRDPILVSSTDGVGTKLRLAMQLQSYDTIGIDLVAMCVNDLIVLGAEPVFFLDYYAVSKLNIDIASRIMTGVAQGCLESGCSLVGGETAEMPGMYRGEDCDLAGFSLGIVEKEGIIDGYKVRDGDVLVALGSSGLHSNGYSLVRQLVEHTKISIDTSVLNGQLLAEILLTPTRIYVKSILTLIEQINVHAIVHVTGGGLLDNLPRVLPVNVQAVIEASSWDWPPIFCWIQQSSYMNPFEMYRTFNCGVGMVIIIDPSSLDQVLHMMSNAGELAWKIGFIKSSSSSDRVVIHT